MTVITEVIKTSSSIDDGRTISDVMLTVMEEVGELATEVAIAVGHKNRDVGPDGVVGEALDAIIALVDIIYLVHPSMSPAGIEKALVAKTKTKLEKWKRSVDDKYHDHMLEWVKQYMANKPTTLNETEAFAIKQLIAANKIKPVSVSLGTHVCTEDYVIDGVRYQICSSLSDNEAWYEVSKYTNIDG